MLFASSIRTAAITLAAFAALASAPAQAGVTKLTLINGWKSSVSYAKPAISVSKGIVRLQGAMLTTGTNAHPFVLPLQYRPAFVTYLPVDMCVAHNGRIIAYPSGDVEVEAEGDFNAAKCFVSLEGVSFAVSAGGFKNLALKNGWASYGSSTATPAIRNFAGIVHLQGAMKTSGSDTTAFSIPASMRPEKTVYIKADLCEAANGRIRVLSTGDVTVQAENDFASAQCFTSLEGISYAKSSDGFTQVTLANGWTTYASDTGVPAVKLVNGAVVFQGAMKTTGSTAQAFILPAGMRPSKITYVPVDMWGAQNGRLSIDANGNVTVQAEGNFDSAKGFVSLEGVSFRP